jgi:hypothetical protein
VTVPTVQIPVPRGALFPLTVEESRMKAPLLKIPPPKCASFPLTVEELKVAVPRLDLLSDQLFNVVDGTVLAASDPG